HRRSQVAARRAEPDRVTRQKLPFRRPIGNVDGLLSENEVLEHTSRGWLKWSSLPDKLGESLWDVEFCGRAERAIPIVEHDAELCSADARGILQHGLEHGVQLAGRTTNYVQHLRGRGLLLQRLGKLARACLHLIEQSHVLDGNHRLVSEGRYQLDLLVGEGAHLLAPQDNHPDGRAFAYERHAQS